MKVVVLTGGVGGAKLVEGLYRLLTAGNLTAVVNTGDDFIHLGLPISPDIDTLLYTMAGKANRSLGWGREDETWNFMVALRSLGGEDWFNLGDGDLALHVLRGQALAQGEALSAITARFVAAWGLELAVLPMSDEPVATWLDTSKGPLPFQRYFVECRCEPLISGVRFQGAAQARPAPGVVEAIMAADAVLIAPSNPWLSVDPILAVPGVRAALQVCAAPVVAVSPLVEGRAVKGPTAKLMAELGLAVSNFSIGEHYAGLLDAMLIHGEDAAPECLVVARTDTLMHDADDRARVARAALKLAGSLKK